jgi:hypothetical protein
MSQRKPIRVFYSPLSNTFYASQHYRQDGSSVVITGAKYDVTQDIAAEIFEHDIEFTRITPEADESTHIETKLPKQE